LQTEDEQTGIVVEVEDPDAAESLSQDTVDTETDKSVDDVSESFVEDSVTDENLTEKIDDTRTDGQPEDVKETSVEDPDTIESCIEKADDIQTVSQSDEAILEVAAETERLVEDVESLQTDDKQTGLIVETEDSDAAESPSQDTEDAKADKSVDDVSESVVEDSVTVENTTEKIDDTKTDGQPEDVNETSIDDPDTIENSIEKADDTQTDNQAGEVIDADADVEETVIGDSAAENQTVVDRIKKFFSGIFRIDSKVDDSTQEGIESQVEAEGFTEGTDGIHADKQVDADEDIESPETVATHTGKADDIRTDNQEVSAAGDNFEVSDDEILTAVYSDKKTYRTKKSGIIISVFIVIAAVILLIVASIERRSAKKALVQISKVAESVKQMQEETLKGREQVTHSQIESGELVIDALSLTRNGLELERANSDEVEVKRIIGVFINDIDVRITKIKGNIVLLKNKLKEAD
jgi:hypothetical protein